MAVKKVTMQPEIKPPMAVCSSDQEPNAAAIRSNAHIRCSAATVADPVVAAIAAFGIPKTSHNKNTIERAKSLLLAFCPNEFKSSCLLKAALRQRRVA